MIDGVSGCSNLAAIEKANMLRDINSIAKYVAKRATDRPLERRDEYLSTAYKELERLLKDDVNDIMELES